MTVPKEVEKQLKLGIKKGIWMYSPAARSSCEHQALNNIRFSLKRGLWFRGKYIYPREEPGCLCIHRAIIPGFDDERISMLSKLRQIFLRLFRSG